MGWLDRLFGRPDPAAKPAPAQAQPAPAPAQAGQSTATAPIPPERIGLQGEYDQSGLAKRVAKAFDDAGFDDDSRVWIAQRGTVVVLKGTCESRTVLENMINVARNISGATGVETDQVKIE
jgi:osmotically-inducible protein OsmY